jgi:hypothetical protein
METQNSTNHTAENTTVQITAVLFGAEVVLAAVNLNGKYIKQVLQRLEADGLSTPQTRKHVLDGFNDYARELQELLAVIAR